MSRFTAVVAAGFVASSIAFAQTAAPSLDQKQREQAVQSMTQGNPNNDAGAAATAKQQSANVKASDKTKKMTTAEKNAAIKSANTKMVNPNNPSGSVAGTAVQQEANVAASKAASKAPVNMNTPAAESAMQKAATK